MQNLKVKVSSVEESKEVQELFFELGYELFNKKSGDKKHTGWVVSFKDGDLCLDEADVTRHKEITIPQLKDMVILKRNSIEDATHGVVGSDGKYYLTPSSFYEYINGYWECVNEYVNGLEFFKLNNNDLPFIDSEKDVKEYLEPMPNGDYRYHADDGFSIGGDWIEIPKDAVKAYLNNSKSINFVNSDDDYMNGVTNGEWVSTHRGLHEKCGHILVWQRNPQKESLNDKVASAEEALNDKIGSAKGGGKKQPVKSDGGSSSYYFTKLPQHFIDEIIASGGIEIKDIVRHCFYNDADCKDIIKALKRIQESKRGGGKLGVDVSYDANKILFFANEIKNSIENLNRELKIMQRG